MAVCAVAMASGLALSTPGPAVSAQAGSNPISIENALPGNDPSEWDIVAPNKPDPNLEGFASSGNSADPAMSVNVGGSISFKVRTDATQIRVMIYRLGYYGGQGAREIADLGTVAGPLNWSSSGPDTCLRDDSVGLVDCSNWTVAKTWQVPVLAVSGIYIAKLIRVGAADGRSNHIFFVVREDNAGSDILFQTSDTTWQAYNYFGGQSLYYGRHTAADCTTYAVPHWENGRSVKVSYHRPFKMIQGTESPCVTDVHQYFRSIHSGFFSAEYSMVRFLERNGYDVAYMTGGDVEIEGAKPVPDRLTSRKVFLSVGHDEYWSGNQRSAVERARAAGVNLAFFSGNDVYVKTRWEGRTLVTYKDTISLNLCKPVDPHPDIWTGTWYDKPRRDWVCAPPNKDTCTLATHPTFAQCGWNPPPQKDGGRPQYELTGTYWDNGAIDFDNHGIPLPDTDTQGLRFWRNVNWAGYGPGATLGDRVLGYEWNQAPTSGGFADNAPAGLIRLSAFTWSDINPPFRTFTHHLTMHRNVNGALVFSAGTIQWSWALAESRPYVTDTGMTVPLPVSISTPLQQATINILADMGAIPVTRDSHLADVSPTSDTVLPQIVSVSNPNNVAIGSDVLIQGTAVDAGGGKVASVEISADDGVTWQFARPSSAGNWSYSWHVAQGPAAVNLRFRPVDDSGNLGTEVTRSVIRAFGCPPAISPSGRNAPPAGGLSTVTVTTSACAWSVSSSASWLSIVSGQSGSSTAMITYLVAPNHTASSRTATLSISGQIFAVTQLAGRSFNDVNNDGSADFVLRNVSGSNTIWLMNGVNRPAGNTVALPSTADPSWEIRAVADMNGDMDPDLVWQHPNGQLAVWLFDDTQVQAGGYRYVSPRVAEAHWKIVGAADMDRDGVTDLIWQNRELDSQGKLKNGLIQIWHMKSDVLLERRDFVTLTNNVAGSLWEIDGVADISGDGWADFVWRNYNPAGLGQIALWRLVDATISSTTTMTTQVADLAWRIVGLADINHDGTRDLVWFRSTDRKIAVWFLNPGVFEYSTSTYTTPQNADAGWKLVGVR
jgi:hypothetical protein